METPSTQNRQKPELSKHYHFVFLLLWIITGVLGFLLWGHERFIIFPSFIFAWLLLGIGWFTAMRWKWKAIVLAPILTALACSGLSILYLSYDDELAKLALNKFISTTINGNVSSEFSVGNERFSDGTWNKEIWTEMQKNASPNYVIEYSDNFFGAHEWVVRFEGGPAYFLSFQQTSLGHWSVSIEDSE
jgi:hypothetical protein